MACGSRAASQSHAMVRATATNRSTWSCGTRARLAPDRRSIRPGCLSPRPTRATGRFDRLPVRSSSGLVRSCGRLQGHAPRMLHYGVEFVTEPRDEPYGRVVVFLDISRRLTEAVRP